MITLKEWLKVTLNPSPLQKNEDEPHIICFKTHVCFMLVALSHHLQKTDTDKKKMIYNFEKWLLVSQAVNSCFHSNAFLLILDVQYASFLHLSFGNSKENCYFISCMAVTEIHIYPYI